MKKAALNQCLIPNRNLQGAENPVTTTCHINDKEKTPPERGFSLSFRQQVQQPWADDHGQTSWQRAFSQQLCVRLASWQPVF